MAQTVALIDRFVREWQEVGLSQWVVRDASGALLGLAGVVPRERWWNLGYRFTPSAWGRGLATDVSLEAITLARELRPDLPVITRSLANNPASGRVAERAGLRLAWRGPSTDGPERLVHADRDLDPDVLAALVELG
ncbi:GNAT family N-acetyltransferase [Aeromicrobium terrae]|uniref:GNAT family N-acetyltransferase n=1 Tax=Aeromicrobium terrae TaxID=2498846 RepID=A0A5C8NQX4_9ACTN|nr:GNAT family N-acetyltransferase [Aeromicrobium terrae]